MAKKSDSQTIDNLPSEFNRLRNQIEALRTDANSDTISQALRWLGVPGVDDDNYATLWGKRRKFCARFTYTRFTWGQDSSQRNESMNSGARARDLFAYYFFIRSSFIFPAKLLLKVTCFSTCANNTFMCAVCNHN